MREAFMGIRSHALYSRLYSDLSDQITPMALDRIKAKEFTWPEQTFKERAAASIAESLLKKQKSSLNDVTKARALDKFLLINDQCETWSLQPTQFGDDFLVGELRQLIYKFWHRLDTRIEGSPLVPLVDHPYDLLERGGVGPGSAIGSLGGDFYTKLFSSRMAVTDQSLYLAYKRYIRGFPEWSNAELTRALTYGDPEIVEGEGSIYGHSLSCSLLSPLL
jgi:hypothetical protein